MRGPARIPRMDWAGRTEGRGNAGETAGFYFHQSGPPGFGYLIQLKSLIYQSKLARGAGRVPFHPVNPGPEYFRNIAVKCRCLIHAIPNQSHPAIRELLKWAAECELMAVTFDHQQEGVPRRNG